MKLNKKGNGILALKWGGQFLKSLTGILILALIIFMVWKFNSIGNFFVDIGSYFGAMLSGVGIAVGMVDFDDIETKKVNVIMSLENNDCGITCNVFSAYDSFKNDLYISHDYQINNVQIADYFGSPLAIFEDPKDIYVKALVFDQFGEKVKEKRINVGDYGWFEDNKELEWFYHLEVGSYTHQVQVNYKIGGEYNSIVENYNLEVY
jgi:hypothetical protein